MARVDYDRMAAVYDAGRDRSLDQRRAWREALGRHLPPPCGCPGAVLDLGAGTGQWARALTTWFGVPVVAVEPSAGMRAAAESKHLDRVHVVGGRGEAPDAGGLVGLSFLLEFFPGAERVLATFPRLTDTVALFERAGFVLVGMRAVADLAAASLGDALERARLRADTVLRHLPDAEFRAGVRRLEAAAAAEDPARPAGPIFGRIPLVVLAK